MVLAGTTFIRQYINSGWYLLWTTKKDIKAEPEPKDTPSRKKGTQTQTSVSAISCFLVSCACVAARLTKCNVPTEQCSILKRHIICWCITTCGEQRWEKHESISHRALWLYLPSPVSFIFSVHTQQTIVYWFLNQLLMSRPVSDTY